MHKMPVSAERYLKKMDEVSEGEMPSEMLEYCTPVDLNGAYVPLRVTQESKGSDTDLQKSAENSKYRFNLGG